MSYQSHAWFSFIIFYRGHAPLLPTPPAHPGLYRHPLVTQRMLVLQECDQIRNCHFLLQRCLRHHCYSQLSLCWLCAPELFSRWSHFVQWWIFVGLAAAPLLPVQPRRVLFRPKKNLFINFVNAFSTNEAREWREKDGLSDKPLPFFAHLALPPPGVSPPPPDNK